MSVTVRIPGPLRRITNGVDKASVGLEAAMNEYPAQGSPLRKAASALRPHSALIAAFGLFLLVGLAVLDDYGGSPDERAHRLHTEITIDYVSGDGDVLLRVPDRTHGVAVLLPLALAERALGLENSRELSLARHLVTHLFFLTGGLFAYLLAARIFNNKWTALLAMLLFLSHPRLYAHSFVNDKDIPFLTAFAVALFLTDRAFRRGDLWAFALLGAGVGTLINIRAMGSGLVPAVLAMCGLDLFGAGERKRVLLSASVFVLAAGLAMYAGWPYLWTDPAGRFIESLTQAARHFIAAEELFMGTPISNGVPAWYIPTWFSITTPPFALLLGCIGTAALLRRRAPAPRSARLRFGALTAACFGAPIAAAILFESSIFNGWRHLYFLWAPFSLLAAFGLHWLSDVFARRRARTLVYGTVGVGVAATLVSMIALHPNQQVYFNFTQDRVTQDRLSERYVMDYWNLSLHELHRHLLNEGPSTITIRPRGAARGSLNMLSKADRERISIVNPSLADFSVRWTRPEEGEETLRVIEVYNNALSALVKEQPGADPFPAAYDAALSLDPIVRSGFDLYAINRVLTYVKEPCNADDLEGGFFLRFYPLSPDNLPEEWRWAGYEETRFRFLERGSLFDGKCVALVPMPDYPVLNVNAYQSYEYANKWYWGVLFPLMAERHYSAYEAARNREPDARAAFDLYLDRRARTLTYVKETCAPSDIERKFFLHIAPKRVADLPEDRRESGFDNLDFAYLTRGVLFDGKCAAVLPLPDYAVERLRTGQFVGGEGEAWEATVAFGE